MLKIVLLTVFVFSIGISSNANGMHSRFSPVILSHKKKALHLKSQLASLVPKIKKRSEEDASLYVEKSRILRDYQYFLDETKRLELDLNNLESEDCSRVFTLACKYNQKAIVNFLIEHGDIDPNWQDDAGCTALHYACRQAGYFCNDNDGQIALAIISSFKNINFNIINNYGSTVLTSATSAVLLTGKMYEVIERLLAQDDLEINYFPESNRVSPFVWALYFENARVANVFLNHKDINVFDSIKQLRKLTPVCSWDYVRHSALLFIGKLEKEDHQHTHHSYASKKLQIIKNLLLHFEESRK